MADEKLLRYFIDQTDKRFDQLGEQIQGLHSRLDNLNEFKVKMIVSSRWISGLISASFGLITLSASMGLSIYLSRQERQALIEAAKIEKPVVTSKKDHT
jgi:hypothetical protein